MVLCAGRTGQLFNASQISNELGVSVPTIQSWISVLEASYILFLLPPWYSNINKRLVKTPKLYFYDVGLAAFLLGITNTNHVSRDPLRGMLFENMIVADVIKNKTNKGQISNAFFYRDSNANEVDLIIGEPDQLVIIEIKSAQTFNTSFNKGLYHFRKTFPDTVKYSIIAYDGADMMHGSDQAVIHYRGLQKLLDSI